MNIFKNILNLEIWDEYDLFEAKLIAKINLPKLKSLTVFNTNQLSCFTGLMELKHFEIRVWDENINLGEIFDPAKILEV
jgi:hypothetical protein